jgi:hypothetical protein
MSHLSPHQRHQIQQGISAGKSNAQIAREIGVHRSTVGREIQRNALQRETYEADKAQYYAKLTQRMALSAREFISPGMMEGKCLKERNGNYPQQNKAGFLHKFLRYLKRKSTALKPYYDKPIRKAERLVYPYRNTGFYKRLFVPNYLRFTMPDSYTYDRTWSSYDWTKSSTAGNFKGQRRVNLFKRSFNAGNLRDVNNILNIQSVFLFQTSDHPASGTPPFQGGEFKKSSAFDSDFAKQNYIPRLGKEGCPEGGVVEQNICNAKANCTEFAIHFAAATVKNGISNSAQIQSALQMRISTILFSSAPFSKSAA